MNDLARVQIRTDGVTSALIINDEDITDKVQAVFFEAQSQGMPVIGIQFRAADFDFSGPGVVQVLRQSSSEALLEWLDSVDLEKLDAIVMNSDYSTRPVVAFMDALKELARART